MKDSNTISTPIALNVLIDKDERGVDFNVTRYICILYLTASRSYIMFSLCMCARYQVSPKDSHFKIIKHILKYLIKTFNHVVSYPKGSACSLVGYFGSDFMGFKSIGRVLVVHVTNLEVV